MSFQITTAFVEQYSANVEHLAQQQDSRFAGKVREESQQGKSKAWEQLGATRAVKRTSRHADTPRVDSNHQRRWCYLSDYDWSDLIDTLDDVKMLIDPKSSYAQSAAFAMNVAMDEEVITAATGTAYADTGGGSGVGSATVLPAAQKVAVNYVATGAAANSGLTLAKLIKAKSILGKAEFPGGSQLFFAYTQQQLDDLLLNVSQVSNADYAAVKALVDGEVSYFMGFNFIRMASDSTAGAALTLTTATDVRTCFAYAKVALLRATGKAPSGSVDKRTDKNNAWQVYANMSVGATRMQEKGVVEVMCDESP